MWARPCASCTFVAEPYLAFGLVGVLLGGVLFGVAAGRWSRVCQQEYSSLAQIGVCIRVSVRAMTTRSVLTMVPLILPTFGLWKFGRFRSQTFTLDS